MATLREAVISLLTADVTLSALLTGGVLDASDFSFDGGGMDEAPHVTDSSRIKPFAVVRWQSSDQFGPLKIKGEIQSFEVYAYQNAGYSTIEPALSRIKVLLDQVRVNADDRQLAYFVFNHESQELNAPEQGHIPCKFMRFMVTIVR